MHDIDRTQAEFEDQQEFEGPGSYDLQPAEFEDNNEFEFEFELENGVDSGEAEIVELASELMQVNDEAELEAFLGKFLRDKLRKLRARLPGSVLQPLGGILKSGLKKLVPIASTALGTSIGGPFGGMVGRKLGDTASGLLGLELEGLSPEDQEFEIAKQLARFADKAVESAANIAKKVAGGGLPIPGVGLPIPGVEIAKRAVMEAAKSHAPGFVNAAKRIGGGPKGRHYGREGRWVRVRDGILLIRA